MTLRHLIEETLEEWKQLCLTLHQELEQLRAEARESESAFSKRETALVTYAYMQGTAAAEDERDAYREILSRIACPGLSSSYHMQNIARAELRRWEQ